MERNPGFQSRPAPVNKLVQGFIGVANVDLDESWLGNHLSQANLYGFGRLAWNPDLSARQIIDEWTIQTFGPETVDTISKMQLTSWRTYENYTGPLGLQTLTDIVGNHYGVAVEASERNGWGQWHRAARCTASFHYEGPSGWHEIRIQYFEQSTGISSFRLFVGAQLIDQWTAANQVPERRK